MSFIKKQELLQVLRENHTRFLDGPLLFKQALLDARDSDYRTITPEDPAVNLKAKIIISKFEVASNNKFQIWVEFSVPRPEGHVVGTHVYDFDLLGTFELKESYGTIFSGSHA